MPLAKPHGFLFDPHQAENVNVLEGDDPTTIRITDVSIRQPM